MRNAFTLVTRILNGSLLLSRMKKDLFRAHEFAAALRQAMQSRSTPLRMVSDHTTLSVSTISRIQGGEVPGLHSYLALCEWMGRRPGHFTTIDDVPPITPRLLVAYVSGDPGLDPGLRQAVASLLFQIYRDADLI